jgi:molecular chaperone GrpE
MQSDEKMRNSESNENPDDEMSGTDRKNEPKNEIEEARLKADKASQDVLYLRADLENTRRRLLREQEQAIRFANERLIGEMARVVDLFDRAIASGGALPVANPDVTSFVTGVEMTQKELVGTLEKFGVEFLGKAGESFDPQRHEAISQVQAGEDQIDKVVQVVQRGCALHGRTLVPARVVVGIG